MPSTTPDKRSPKLLFSRRYIPFWWISISFLVIFLAYNSVQALEAAVNKRVGAAAVAVIYFGLVVGNLIAPAMLEVLFKGNLQYAMGFGALTYSVFILSSVYPEYWVMLPAAFFMGLGGGVLWISQAMSMMRLARHIAHEEQAGNSETQLTDQANQVHPVSDDDASTSLPQIQDQTSINLTKNMQHSDSVQIEMTRY